MTLAEVETRFTPRAPEPPAPAAAPARTCEACGAGMAAGQEWCLECGTAAPAAAATPPGRRAFATVSSLTVLLLAGAAVASYAAVSGDAGRQAAAPPPPSANAIAQTPPAVTPPPAATTPAAPPAATPAKPLPKVAPPPTAQPAPTVTAKPVTPAAPATPVPSTPSKPTTTHHKAAAPRAGATTGQQVTLDPSNGTLYDPYGRASAQGDPTRALDGNPSTSWFVTVATPDTMGVGYVVDIANPVNVRSLMLWTRTEGFEVEVYGTGSTVLPPDVVDSRWIHLATRTNVDASQPGVAAPDGNVAGDGKERIVLNSGTKRFRHLLLWFTQPPETGQTVRLGELRLFT